MKEQIKPIKDFPKYFISNLGNIYTEYWGTRKLLKPRYHKSGYLYAGIYRKLPNGKSERKWLRIHRLVYQHFIGELDTKLQINHINHNKQDNRVQNLEQVTAKENIRKYWKKRREDEKNKTR
jgi:hypothetical protein